MASMLDFESRFPCSIQGTTFSNENSFEFWMNSINYVYDVLIICLFVIVER